MTYTVDAVFENGVLRPIQPLALGEREQVRVTVESNGSWTAKTAGMLKWTGDPEALRKIAEGEEFGALESP